MAQQHQQLFVDLVPLSAYTIQTSSSAYPALNSEREEDENEDENFQTYS